MKARICMMASIVVLAAVVFCLGCSSGTTPSSAASSSAAASSAASVSASAASSADASSTTLADGEYTVQVKTDSSMFHINEAYNGTGKLTVKNGKMTVHMVLVSKKITNLYAGTAEEAKADAQGVIQPTTDKVTYSDGMEEEVYGFDVPVPAIGEEFNVAILGEKGTWYDHKVTVSDPVKD